MSWEKKLQKAPELSRTAGWEPEEVSNIDESIDDFLEVWQYNRKAAYKRQGFTPEEIQETEKAAEKLALAKQEFLEFLKTLDWD
jgi:hypothetical protein